MKKEWEKSEHRAATFLGHQLVKGSGRGFRKSDNVGEERRGEHKSTRKAFFRLTEAHLRKIQQEALSSGREPVFTIETPHMFYECIPDYESPPEITVKNSFAIKTDQPIVIQIGAEKWKITPHPRRKSSLSQK